MPKHVLVTGASSGIGLTLCKLLIRDHDCYVYLGSRNVAKGEAAMKSILDEVPNKSNRIEVLQIDVGDHGSVLAAAKKLRDRGVNLYGLVNNAGIGFATANNTETMMNTNYYGPKRVTEAFLDLLDPKEGRIVNTSSGAASMWVKKQDNATKKLYSNPSLTFEELDKSVQANIAAKNFGEGFTRENITSCYGLSKAALTALTLVQAKAYPNLKVTSLSPGFVATPMTRNAASAITPEQGCKSSIKCLFGPVTSGFYYGSDGLRSPLICSRDPGTPEYQGEENPDPKKYTKN